MKRLLQINGKKINQTHEDATQTELIPMASVNPIKRKAKWDRKGHLSYFVALASLALSTSSAIAPKIQLE